MSYSAYVQDSNGMVRKLQKGDSVTTFRSEDWTFQSVAHPRKIFVTQLEDPNGPKAWPNMASREFFASVLNAGIWDNEMEIWTFSPDWDHPSDPTIFDDFSNPGFWELPDELDNQPKCGFCQDKGIHQHFGRNVN